MKVLLIDNGTTLLNALRRLIPNDEVVKRFDLLNNVEINDFDIIVLSGSSVYPIIGNEEKFSHEIEFIKNTTKPIIGICFGCELIVKAFGGELKKLDHKSKGIKEVEILDKSLCKNSTINVYENHEYVIERMPESFNILAKSEVGPEIVKHKTLPIYGFQFHPENFVDELDGDDIFLKLFFKILSV